MKRADAKDTENGAASEATCLYNEHFRYGDSWLITINFVSNKNSIQTGQPWQQLVPVYLQMDKNNDPAFLRTHW